MTKQSIQDIILTEIVNIEAELQDVSGHDSMIVDDLNNLLDMYDRPLSLSDSELKKVLQIEEYYSKAVSWWY